MFETTRSETVSRCKSCGAAIEWVETTAGKDMPVDPGPVSIRGEGERAVMATGEVVTLNDRETVLGYVPHWNTCDEPDAFRSSR